MTVPVDSSGKKILVDKMIKVLTKETPDLCSLILERNCNLNCAHCFFKKEKTSAGVSMMVELESKVLSVVSQLPKNSAIIHEGRILKSWHVPLLKKIRESRGDISIGLLDNGSYLKNEFSLRENNFLFDWIDISVDGPRQIHNLQRCSQTSFDEAIAGLKRAKEFVVPEDGKVTSLFTATRVNYKYLAETAKLLIDEGLIDELHVTPASEVVSKNNHVVMSDQDWFIFWKQFKQARNLGIKSGVKIFLKLYQLKDIMSLSRVVGRKEFFKGFNDTDFILVDRGSVSFVVDGVRITYIPMSICSSETFVVDADGKYRLAYSVQYTLEELNEGIDSMGNKIEAYTVCEINSDSNYKNLYSLGAKQWFTSFGNKELEEEIKFFSSKY